MNSSTPEVDYPSSIAPSTLVAPVEVESAEADCPSTLVAPVNIHQDDVARARALGAMKLLEAQRAAAERALEDLGPQVDSAMQRRLDYEAWVDQLVCEATKSAADRSDWQFKEKINDARAKVDCHAKPVGSRTPTPAAFREAVEQWVAAWEPAMLETLNNYLKLVVDSPLAVRLPAAVRSNVRGDLDRRAKAATAKLQTSLATDLCGVVAKQIDQDMQDSYESKLRDMRFRRFYKLLGQRFAKSDPDSDPAFATDEAFEDWVHELLDVVFADGGVDAFLGAAVPRYAGLVTDWLKSTLFTRVHADLTADLSETPDSELETLFRESEQTRSRRQKFQNDLALVDALVEVCAERHQPADA